MTSRPIMDTPLLATTNMAPTVTQESFFLERLLSVDTSIDKVTSELARAERVVADLNLRQSTLQEKRQVFASIVSPLRRLPSDLLSEIFFFVVWSSRQLVSDSSTLRLSEVFEGHDLAPPLTHNTSQSRRRSSVDDATQTDWLQEKQLATLLRVCHDWKQVAVCTPLLWNHVQLQVCSTDPPLDDFVQGLQRWFDRAQHAPLSLTLFFSKGSDDPVPMRFNEFLWENRRRWRELRLHMPTLGAVVDLFDRSEELVGEGQGSNGEEGGERGWLNLEVLLLSGWLSANVGGEIFTLEDLASDASLFAAGQQQAMPRLQSLTLHLPYAQTCAGRWIPWAQLRHLSMRTGDRYEDYVGILQRCAELRTCRLFFDPRLPVGIEGNDASTGYGYNIHLPFLEELSLESISLLAPLFDKLTLPSLTRLSICQNQCVWLQALESNIGRTLLDFLSRSCEANDQLALPLSFVNLWMLGQRNEMTELGIPRITISEFVQMFEMLEGLTELHVRDGATNAEFLDVVDEKGLLPNLNRISVEVGKNEEARERFKRFVSARTALL
ncbi:hypothetical protein BKA70DRAFT_691720 [Coprinopsis sp. MPI-PUGE-AT-0042]|nr:hypothetical protein BKA70DRAFT_691720 [Coprinopsis sp. MPI-PUGE-AT-0042]